MLVVALALIAAGLLIGGDDAGSGEPSRAGLPDAQRVEQIQRDVERLRGVKFKRRIEPKVVTPADAEDAALRDADKTYPPHRRRADEELLKLLGLIPPDTDIFKVLQSVARDQVIGYYDPKRKELRLVSGNGADSPALVDVTLAHETVHALEDQVFGLDEPESSTDDEATATTALAEGTATYVTNEFVECCVDQAGLALGSLASAFGGGTGLPPYVERTLVFSYTGGEKFVRELHRAAGGWQLVNAALRSQPPVSTEQIIHADKYVPFEPPLKVALSTRSVLGSGWKRTADGTLGELDTSELLRLGDPGRAEDAAAGWGGGRYELWQRSGPAPAGCKPPCRRRDALVLAWRWDSPAEAREFVPVARDYVRKGLKGRPEGKATWALDGGAVAMATGERSTTLAFAPTADLAERLADRAAVRR